MVRPTTTASAQRDRGQNDRRPEAAGFAGHGRKERGGKSENQSEQCQQKTHPDFGNVKGQEPGSGTGAGQRCGYYRISHVRQFADSRLASPRCSINPFCVDRKSAVTTAAALAVAWSASASYFRKSLAQFGQQAMGPHIFRRQDDQVPPAEKARPAVRARNSPTIPSRTKVQPVIRIRIRCGVGFQGCQTLGPFALKVSGRPVGRRKCATEYRRSRARLNSFAASTRREHRQRPRRSRWRGSRPEPGPPALPNVCRTAYPTLAITLTQSTAPRKLNSRNLRQGMRRTPASGPAIIRMPAMKRATKIVAEP